MTTKQPTQLCYQVNGGTCRNKVSAKNGYICAVGHRGRQDYSAAQINVSEPSDKISLASSLDTPSHLLKKLANDRSITVKIALASNAAISLDIQTSLSKDLNERVRTNLLKNPNIASDIEVELCANGSEEMRLIAAAKEGLAEETQLFLLKDSSTGIARALATNTSISTAAQNLLIERYDDHMVLQRLAQNTHISEESQLKLLDKDISVVSFLVNNPSITKKTAIQISQRGYAPYGYYKKMDIDEMLASDQLSLMRQFPEEIAKAYLNKLLFFSDGIDKYTQMKKELTLTSFFALEKANSKEAPFFRKEIKAMYLDDEEVSYLLKE